VRLTCVYKLLTYLLTYLIVIASATSLRLTDAVSQMKIDMARVGSQLQSSHLYNNRQSFFRYCDLRQCPLANAYEFIISRGISLPPHCTYVQSFNFRSIVFPEISLDETNVTITKAVVTCKIKRFSKCFADVLF